MADPRTAPPIEEVVAQSGIAYPNERPYTHITFVMVVWNDEQRAKELLNYVRPHFETLVVGVQDSPDGTLAVANEVADVVVEDRHHGFGDATFGPKLLPRVPSPWTLKLDADEWPSEDLLSSLSNATWWADQMGTAGVWIPFGSSVDGLEYEEQHAHLRLFRTAVGWPASMHSRPPIENGILWQTGHIRHDRSLDELVQDYLRYLERSHGNQGWINHNKIMIRSAVTGIASVKGWDYVKAFEWWPRVETLL